MSQAQFIDEVRPCPALRRVDRMAEKFGSGGVIPINSGLVVPFISTDRRRRSVSAATPSYCGNGHPLTAANLAKSGSRWRCRRCGAERAARFRVRGE